MPCSTGVLVLPGGLDNYQFFILVFLPFCWLLLFALLVTFSFSLQEILVLPHMSWLLPVFLQILREVLCKWMLFPTDRQRGALCSQEEESRVTFQGLWCRHMFFCRYINVQCGGLHNKHLSQSCFYWSSTQRGHTCSTFPPTVYIITK